MDCVRSPQLLMEALGHVDYDVVLIDLNYTRDTTSGQEGLDLLARIQEFDSRLPVIVMTAWGNLDLAVEAMRRGARDFIQKPWENERLLTILRTQVELHRALQRAERLAAENRLLHTRNRPDFIASSPSMQPLLDAIARVGPSDANVLITGEHGIGIAKKPWWSQATSATNRAVHAALKNALDPAGILNPGKFIPAAKAPSKKNL